MNNRWVLYNGRTYPVRAEVTQNNIAHVCIMPMPGRPKLIPVKQMIEAPMRTKPTLVWSRP